MTVQAINTNLMNVAQILPKSSNYSGQSAATGLENNGEYPQFTGNNGITSLSLTSEYFSSDKTVVQFQSKDGDSVTLSSESVEYQKAMLTANGNNSKEDWQKVINYLKEQYSSMKAEIVKGFLKSNGVDVQDETGTDGTAQTTSTDSIPGLPEYWNAENTSQRIVDFATSFLSMFKGSGQDFLAMIKDAIDQGFSQAKDITGDLPDPVSKLVNNTHDLVMKKLDAWALQQGIASDTSSDGTQTAEQTITKAA
jgi:hypothetical protein